MTKEQKEQKEQNKNVDELNQYEILDDKARRIIDLRIEGWKYKRLESIALVKEGTIRKWFMNGGQYHEAYNYRRDQLFKEALEDYEEAPFHLRQGVADAIVVIKSEVSNKNWRAAVALLKMVGFDVHRILTDDESEGTKLLKELITMRRNEKHKSKSRKPIFDRKSKDTILSKSKKNL